MKKVLLILGLSFSYQMSIAEDLPQAANKLQATLLAEITSQGQKINAIALEYEDQIFTGDELEMIYQVTTRLDQQDPQNRQILRAYSNDQAALSNKPKAGKFVILELNPKDQNASPYELIVENKQPMKFKARGENNQIIDIDKVQSNKVPKYYNQRLNYQIQQNGLIKLTNGKTIQPNNLNIPAYVQNIKTPYLDQFKSAEISLQNPENKLNYKIYIPKIETNKQYPLSIFLHGSGQVGKDNLAHLLSSKGAIASLLYEEGFVLAPQYNEVFDPFDGNKAIHWQSENRQKLLVKMLTKTLNDYPNIDKNRIYIIGLSRGAEGGLNLLRQQPDLFAGALLMSGREVDSWQWVEGNGKAENLATIKNIPIWFFHSKEDNVAPVSGSRINYQLLQELKAPQVKYTEFTMQQQGDNGIINNNPHNSWDAVFNSPAVLNWLLNQHKKEK